MILPAILLFALIAAGLVWLMGRHDAARDPKLTLGVLLLLAGFPLLSALPKVELRGLPADPVVFTTWLPWIWSGGAMLCSLRLVFALGQLIRWRQVSIPIPDAGGQMEVRLLPGLKGPIATGVFRPLILVPEDWNRWSDSLKATVLAHETAHHKRHDPLWRAIAAIICTLHWFNPLVWWMASRLADQCEFACDEQVVQDGVDPRNYARDLCDVATVCRAPATTLAMAQRSGLESRVRRLLSSPTTGSKRALVASSVCAFGCAAALAMIERVPSDWIPAIPAGEIQTRLSADPFPGDAEE